MSARIVLNFEHGLAESAVERRPEGGTFVSLWQSGEVLIVKLSEASLHALWLELSKAVGMLAPARGAAGGGPSGESDAETGSLSSTRSGVAVTTPEERGAAKSNGMPATQGEAETPDACSPGPGELPEDGGGTAPDRMSLGAPRPMAGATSGTRAPRRKAAGPGRR
jgi:hypothetical protein